MSKFIKIISLTMAAAVLMSVFALFSVSAANDDFFIEGGVLYEYLGDDENVVIPDGVTEIDSGAFKNNTDIVSVVVPEGVKTIGNETFRGCSSLRKAKLPESLIFDVDPSVCDGGETFKDCEVLTDVTISSKALCIPRNFFANCISLEKFAVPDTVQAVGDFAFCRTSLTEITFPEGCTSFGLGAVTMIGNGRLEQTGMTCTVTVYCQNPQFDVDKPSDEPETPLFGQPEQTNCRFFAQGIEGGTFQQRINSDIANFGVNATFKSVTPPVKEPEQTVSSTDETSMTESQLQQEDTKTESVIDGTQSNGISVWVVVLIVAIFVVVLAAAAVCVIIVLKRTQPKGSPTADASENPKDNDAK